MSQVKCIFIVHILRFSIMNATDKTKTVKDKLSNGFYVNSFTNIMFIICVKKNHQCKSFITVTRVLFLVGIVQNPLTYIWLYRTKPEFYSLFFTSFPFHVFFFFFLFLRTISEIIFCVSASVFCSFEISSL